MKATLIINPASGRGRGKRSFPAIARHLDSLKFDFHHVFSEGPGHIIELAREAAEKGSDLIVACGGDGTFHEVINGIDGSPATIGIIPCGTGDDLAVNIGLPRDHELACKALANGVVRHIDLARVGDKVYGCIAGTGFDSKVNRVANEGVRFLRGTSVYIYSVLKTMASFEPLEMAIEADDFRFSGRVMFVVVANAPSYGGGMKIAPMADMFDGFLDLIIIKEMSKIELLKAFPKVFSGSHMNNPHIIHRRVKKVSLASLEHLELFADGEYMKDLPVELEIMPGALPVVVPAES